MRYLQQMAKEARHIVLASIHQPRSAIWAMFDSVRTHGAPYVCMLDMPSA